jgi:hypothetical protein
MGRRWPRRPAPLQELDVRSAAAAPAMRRRGVPHPFCSCGWLPAEVGEGPGTVAVTHLWVVCSACKGNRGTGARSCFFLSFFCFVCPQPAASACRSHTSLHTPADLSLHQKNTLPLNHHGPVPESRRPPGRRVPPGRPRRRGPGAGGGGWRRVCRRGRARENSLLFARPPRIGCSPRLSLLTPHPPRPRRARSHSHRLPP